MINFNEYGYRHPEYSNEMRRKQMEQVQRADEEKARQRAAWDRLCGSLSPIGKREGE